MHWMRTITGNTHHSERDGKRKTAALLVPRILLAPIHDLPTWHSIADAVCAVWQCSPRHGTSALQSSQSRWKVTVQHVSMSAGGAVM